MLAGRANGVRRKSGPVGRAARSAQACRRSSQEAFGRPRGRQGLWGFARAGRFGGGGAALVLVTPSWDPASPPSPLASPRAAPPPLPPPPPLPHSHPPF